MVGESSILASRSLGTSTLDVDRGGCDMFVGVMTSFDGTGPFALQDLQVLQGLVDQVESKYGFSFSFFRCSCLVYRLLVWLENIRHGVQTPGSACAIGELSFTFLH